MSLCTLQDLQDRHLVVKRLTERRLSPYAAERKASLFARASARLSARGTPASTPAIAGFVPGRIEVLGKHTDYAGGRSMVVAVENGFCLVAVPRRDKRITVTDVVTEESVTFTLEGELQPRVGHWSNYPMTVARRVTRNFPGPLRGADVAWESDLPPAAGMSSSSALIVATFLALSAANELPRRDAYTKNIRRTEDLAGYLATVENGQNYGTLAGDRGVGTFGGSEDHTAILCARPGEITQYSYCPVRWERSIRLPEDCTFVIADSGVVAEKTGAAMVKYNRTSQLAHAVIDIWQRETGRQDPHMAAAIASSANAAERLRRLLRRVSHAPFEASELVDRFEQFLAESEQIIPAVMDTLDAAAVQRFGQLVERSQSLGVQLLKNQVPETVFLAEQARRLGAQAASAFGAGFGGSVWALAKTDLAAEFRERWAVSYAERFPQHRESAHFEISAAGPAAFYVSGPDRL